MVGWPKILGGVLVLAAITWVIVEIREDGARSAKTRLRDRTMIGQPRSFEAQ
ncbi:hypothetical protein FB009_12431 [Sinorhizobium medicae]|uniref:hypothetical protein n=1 Tax=Sinorhizobium medicae TaxID=110321 RepID=UPI001198D7A9|nr:hypothetical protein [Sinorhizobium medicae]TWA32634.1 hypothetical protein FB009_12431 [Sinorhizobium medicae]WQO84233.1 hypothetical protein U8C37_11315 [Sinorhizobium medicae]